MIYYYAIGQFLIKDKVTLNHLMTHHFYIQIVYQMCIHMRILFNLHFVRTEGYISKKK